MAKSGNSQATYEKTLEPNSGWPWLTIGLLLIPASIASFVFAVITGDSGGPVSTVVTGIVLFILCLLFAIFIFFGLYTLQPNEARVLILFGSYKGTVRNPGFHFANPFYSRARGRAASRGEGGNRDDSKAHVWGPGKLSTKLSLRARNFNSDTLKVNDNRGNPVEIAAVVVWRVADTAQAVFDVDKFENYVAVQAESAIRSIASHYAYDQGEEDEITLRSGGDEVAAEMTRELQARLDIVGVTVEESRITHLAYAPEIASAMLRRQQAEAVIAARNKIVQGAVSMVQMALKDLEHKDVVTLDDERRAAMVSNLLVVLCGTSEAAPVINAGTLYN